MNFHHGSVNDILKKIAIGLIPVQDRTAVIDVVIKYLSQLSEVSCTYRLKKIKNKWILLKQSKDDSEIILAMPKHKSYLFDTYHEVIDGEALSKKDPELYQQLKKRITKSCFILPIHSLEKIQEVIILKPKKGCRFENEYKTILDGLLTSLIVTFDRITQVERYKNISEKYKLKNIDIQKMNINLAKQVKKEVKKSTEARALADQMAYSATLSALNSGIAHEINNPLSIIQLDLELLSEERKQKPLSHQSVEAFIATLKTNINRIKTITKTLMKYGLTHVGEKQPINIVQLVKDITIMINGSVKRQGITLQCHFPNNQIMVMGENIRLYQVFMNIIKNSFHALKESDCSQRTLCIAVQMVSSSKKVAERKVSISIKDNGIGIEESRLNTIFETAYTNKNSGENVNLGLGLSIAKTVIIEHAGTIDVTSKWLKGSEFFITLPVLE